MKADNRKPEFILLDWPLLVDAEGAAKLLGISKSGFLALHKTGKLGPEPIRWGRKNLWRVYALEIWVRCGCPPRWQWVKMQPHQSVPAKAMNDEGA